MNKKEYKLANIGCLTLVASIIIVFLLIPKSKNLHDYTFNTESTYDAGKNAKVICIYTDCNDYDMIKEHAYHEGSLTDYSLVIFYFNDKSSIPDISNSGFIINAKDQKNAIATYRKYGKKNEEFVIH